MAVRIQTLNRLSEISVLALLAFTTLWRGGKSLESSWLLLGVASLCIILQWFLRREQKITPPQDTLWLAVIAFFLWTVLSYIFSSTPNYGLDEVLRTGALCLLLLWYLQRQPEDFEEQLFPLLTYVTVLVCLIGLFVYIFQPVNRFVGTFFDMRFHTDYWPNAAAQFLLLAWPITLLHSGKSIRGRFPSRVLNMIQIPLEKFGPIGLSLGCLLLTFSRGALIAFLGQVVLLTFLILRQKDSVQTLHMPLRRIAAALFIGFIVFISINEVRSSIHPVQPVMEKVTFTADEGYSSVNERTSFWMQASVLAVQKPVFGWGPYSFRFVQPRMQKNVLATSDHPHNVFLKLAVERGLLAAILFGYILFLVLKPGVQLALSGKRLSVASDHARLGYALLVIAIAGVLAHNLIDYNLQFVGIALPLWLLMAVLLRHAGHRHASSKKYTWLTAKRKISIPVIIAVFLLLIALREAYFLSTSSLGRHAEARNQPIEALHWYAVSSDEWFSRDLLLSKTHLLLNEGRIDEAEETIRTFLVRNAEDSRGWKLLGEVLSAQGHIKLAIQAYEHAFALGSWNDLGMSRGLLEQLFAETYTQPTSDAAADSKRLTLDPRIQKIAPAIEERVLAFTSAIEKNTHFVALSPNPEEAVKILIMLSVLYEENAEKYRELILSIDRKATSERNRMSARPPGWLW